MRHDETIMEMLCRMLRPLVSDAEADEIDDYLRGQDRLRQARDERLRSSAAQAIGGGNAVS